jgi:hypothetical protein
VNVISSPTSAVVELTVKEAVGFGFESSSSPHEVITVTIVSSKKHESNNLIFAFIYIFSLVS